MAVVVVLIAASVAPTAAEAYVDVAASDLPGNGTSDDPYQISNASELQAMEDDLGANYTLVIDIDASGTSEWNGGAGFDPIGDSSTPFTGTFDGNDFTIANLTIDRLGENFVGLFGNVSTTGTIENVRLEALTVTGGQEIRGLAGRSYGVVNRSSVEGTVDGSDWVGVVVGTNYGTVTETYARGSATVDTQDVGGPRR